MFLKFLAVVKLKKIVVNPWSGPTCENDLTASYGYNRTRSESFSNSPLFQQSLYRGCIVGCDESWCEPEWRVINTLFITLMENILVTYEGVDTLMRRANELDLLSFALSLAFQIVELFLTYLLQI